MLAAVIDGRHRSNGPICPSALYSRAGGPSPRPMPRQESAYLRMVVRRPWWNANLPSCRGTTRTGDRGMTMRLVPTCALAGLLSACASWPDRPAVSASAQRSAVVPGVEQGRHWVDQHPLARARNRHRRGRPAGLGRLPPLRAGKRRPALLLLHHRRLRSRGERAVRQRVHARAVRLRPRGGRPARLPGAVISTR